jgi:hypothetical protein
MAVFAAVLACMPGTLAAAPIAHAFKVLQLPTSVTVALLAAGAYEPVARAAHLGVLSALPNLTGIAECKSLHARSQHGAWRARRQSTLAQHHGHAARSGAQQAGSSLTARLSTLHGTHSFMATCKCFNAARHRATQLRQPENVTADRRLGACPAAQMGAASSAPLPQNMAAIGKHLKVAVGAFSWFLPPPRAPSAPSPCYRSAARFCPLPLFVPARRLNEPPPPFPPQSTAAAEGITQSSLSCRARSRS